MVNIVYTIHHIVYTMVNIVYTIQQIVDTMVYIVYTKDKRISNNSLVLEPRCIE